MIGKVIVFAIILLIVAGLGINGTVSALVKGVHNIQTNPTLKSVGEEVVKQTKVYVNQTIQNFTSTDWQNQVGLHP
jgi:hypothetical protein